jgi:hypothetical protein
MYSVPITRLRPTAFILLIDRSGSMTERIVFTGAEMTKARAVSLVAGAFIDELLHRARREGGYGDYYDIAALGYSAGEVHSLVSPGGEFTTPSRLAAAEVRRERISRERILPSGRSVMAVTEQNVWFEERAEGSTPMCAALAQGLSLVERWCRAKRNRASYPPTIINITDGEASDCNEDDIRATAGAIRATGTSDGGTILMNIHLARGGDESLPVLFPSCPEELPDHRYAQLLWDISSDMPPGYNDIIRSLRGVSAPSFRAVGWNSHFAEVTAMMNIGSINTVMI